jgi:hypothetical protein
VGGQGPKGAVAADKLQGLQFNLNNGTKRNVKNSNKVLLNKE